MTKPILFDIAAVPAHVSGIADIRGEWSVARVRSQHEASLVKTLEAFGLDWFLPFEEGRKIDSQGKKRSFRRVLFPAYVPFCCEHREDAWIVSQLDCVCEVIAPPIQKRFVVELSNLFVLVKNGIRIDPCPAATVGRRCRIASGPLRSIEGILVRRNDDLNIVVLETQVLGHGEIRVPLEVIEVVG